MERWRLCGAGEPCGVGFGVEGMNKAACDVGRQFGVEWGFVHTLVQAIHNAHKMSVNTMSSCHQGNIIGWPGWTKLLPQSQEVSTFLAISETAPPRLLRLC